MDFFGPHDKDSTSFESILGYPCLGNLPLRFRVLDFRI